MLNSKHSHLVLIAVLMSTFFLAGFNHLFSIEIKVIDNHGNPVNGFRWLLQEDTTHHQDPKLPNGSPGGPDDPAANLSLGFHASHAPVLQTGKVASADEATPGYDPATDANNTKDITLPLVSQIPSEYFFVSVLANVPGYSVGGIGIKRGQTGPVEIVLNKNPIPTAQISVLVFRDDRPINNAPDFPEERYDPDLENLNCAQEVDPVQCEQDKIANRLKKMEGFRVMLEDAGGKYGASAGHQTTDVFGHPLGTVYDENGQIKVMGDGTITTDERGEAVIKNLAPGKYGVTIIPPIGQENDWQQTTTIEGKKTIDAWVKANEPQFFVEFGPPGYHVFVGFVKPFDNIATLPTPAESDGNFTITGTAVSLHSSRPPQFGFSPGAPISNAWVGLNSGPNGVGTGVYASPADPETGEFSIPNVPGGTVDDPAVYQLVVWDAYMDVVFSIQNIAVPGPDGTTPGVVDLQSVPAFNWFGRVDAMVFNDLDGDGFRDENESELGLLEQAVLLRFRDGSVYQEFPTDAEGAAPFDEVFPFFHWLVMEVDFARFKATGATFVVDAGGPIPPHDGWDSPSFDTLNPQQQFNTDENGAVIIDPSTGLPDVNEMAINPNTGNNLSRTEQGEVLTEAFQVFLGQTIRAEFGKKEYEPGENGGISGMVMYAVTRAENDPAIAAAEPWEPGIPRVQIALYEDADRDGVIDFKDGTGPFQAPDVDNYPLSAHYDEDLDIWLWTPGPEDENVGDTTDNSIGEQEFEFGDAVLITWTDSFDDNLPTGAQGNVAPFMAFGSHRTDAFDGLRNFNQARPGVFDGGFAFTSEDINGLYSPSETKPDTYIVECFTPPGYQMVQEEDQNVGWGDTFCPDVPGFACPEFIGADAHSPFAVEDDLGVNPDTGNPATPIKIPGGPNFDNQPAVPVGELRTVPEFLTLFPTEEEPAPFAGEVRPGVERKQVKLTQGFNGACEFFLFTEVPIAARLVGFVLNDLANEFDPNAPTFGEKQSPQFLPVTVRDFTGRALGRSYTDRWGAYNFLIPSTYTANLPAPSGMSPNMLTVSINDPGPIPNPNAGQPGEPDFITDPNYNPKYSQFTYTFQYMPGSTTYLDTPVVPVGAFASPGQLPVDVEYRDGTPVISQATVPGTGGGPYLDYSGGTTELIMTISSLGTQARVPNPKYNPDCEAPDDCTDAFDQFITRDYSFGPSTAPGRVSIRGIQVPPSDVVWTPETLQVTLRRSMYDGIGMGQLVVIRGDNNLSTEIGVTVTVGPLPAGQSVRRVNPATDSIQDTIDQSSPGDLILLAPGRYEELVIMHTPVKLQGWGAGTTIINAVQAPHEKILNWRDHAKRYYDAGLFDLLPAQEIRFNGIEPALASVEGAGVSVFGSDSLASRKFTEETGARIDGVTIVGASTGGGIFVNGYADFLQISNNRIESNHGFASGGIRIGHDILVEEGEYADCESDHIRILYNQIVNNGAMSGAGGGISLYKGADFYEITENWIAGNFTSGNGGGIGHSGLSSGGLIIDNMIIFNQVFNQTISMSGGGIYIGGQAPLIQGGLTEGSGRVQIADNTIQGNQSVGDGGGIRLERINGLEFQASVEAALANGGSSRASPSDWYEIELRSNFIVNNQSGLAGGGVSLQDAIYVTARNNTIARNDSTATAGEAFDGNPFINNPNFDTFDSGPRPAGLVSRAHTTEELGPIVSAGQSVLSFRFRQGFSNPILVNNALWENRSFYFSVQFVSTNPPAFGSLGLISRADHPDYTGIPGAEFWDMDILGTTGVLAPRSCLLTDNLDNAFYLDPAENPAAPGYRNLPRPADVDGDPSTGPQPEFLATYVNTDRGSVVLQTEFKTQTPPVAQPAFDEGGNFIDVRFGPLSLTDAANNLIGDYHIASTSYLVDAGRGGGFAPDIDGEIIRRADIGADEYYPPNPNLTAPTAIEDALEVASNSGPVSFNVLTNDYDADGDQIRLLRFGGGAPVSTLKGRIQFNSVLGQVTYTPNSNESGEDFFLYRVRDLRSASTRKITIGVIGITIIPPPAPGNAPPAPTLISVQTLTNVPTGCLFSEGTEGIFVLPNDGATPDSEGVIASVGTARIEPNDPNEDDEILISIATPPANGLASAFSTTGGISYTPNAGFSGCDVFEVSVWDQVNPPVSIRVPVLVGVQVPPSPEVVVQLPPDLSAADTDGDSNPFNDNVYLLLGAGDGFSTMADGRPLYGFSFNDLTHLIQGPDSVVSPVSGAPASRGLYNLPLRDVIDIGEGMLGAEFPASTITVKEGQNLYLNLLNVGMWLRPDLFDPHTVHWHGFPEAAPVFDGVPDSSISIGMMANLTYFYHVERPGTYMYHCHVEATEHMQMGMLGNLWVKPIQDEHAKRVRSGTTAAPETVFGGDYAGYVYNDGDGTTGYHVEVPIQIGSFDPDFHDASVFVQPLPFAAMVDRYPLLNGRGYPDTILPDDVGDTSRPELITQRESTYVEAEQGQKILLRISNLNVTRFYTLASSLPLHIVGRDARQLINSTRLDSRRVVSSYDENSGTLTTLNPLSQTDADYVGKTLRFINGPLRGMSRTIATANGGQFTFTVPLPQSPLPTGNLSIRFHISDDRDLSYVTNSVDIGAGVSFDALIDTSEVEPGTYLLYTTNLNYLHNNEEPDTDGALGGMATEIKINPPSTNP